LASISGWACFFACSSSAFSSIWYNFACTSIIVTNWGEAFQIIIILESPSLAVEVLRALSFRWAIRTDNIFVGAFSGGLVARINGAFFSIITSVVSTFARYISIKILYTNCRFASILCFAFEAFIFRNTGFISRWFGDTSSERLVTFCYQTSRFASVDFRVVCTVISYFALCFRWALRRLDIGVDASSFFIARIKSARSSIITVSLFVSACSIDTSCSLASMSWFTVGAISWRRWRRRSAFFRVDWRVRASSSQCVTYIKSAWIIIIANILLGASANIVSIEVQFTMCIFAKISRSTINRTFSQGNAWFFFRNRNTSSKIFVANSFLAILSDMFGESPSDTIGIFRTLCIR
jgi:hypothetical protein